VPAVRRRRWFQFSIGSLFVAIALVALLLFTEMRYVRERQRLIKLAEHAHTVSSMSAIDFSPLLKGGPPPSLPIWRTWLGDEAVLLMQFTGTWPEAEQARIKGYFPEAKIVSFVPVAPPPATTGGLGTTGYLLVPPPSSQPTTPTSSPAAKSP
jgi:hypothetical protein